MSTSVNHVNHVNFNGASFWVESLGAESDPPVVLLHAGVATARMWDPIVATLSADHHVVRYDARGFGRTRTENVAFSDVDDVLAVMAAIGIERATLIGASRGGRIAIDTALAHSGKVAGLVTIGSSPSGFPDVELTQRELAASEAMDELLARGEHAELNRVQAELWAAGTTRELLELDPVFLGTAYALNAENLPHVDESPTPTPLTPPAYGRTSEITVPSLFVIGQHDLSPALAATEYLLSTVPDSSEARFPDSAHFPSVERPDEFARVLTSWLADHRL